MKEKYIIPALLVMSAIVCITGFRWGLPSPALNKLYFSGGPAIEERFKAAESEKTGIPRSFYNPIRSYHPDEYFVIKSLQSIDPKELRLNSGQFAVGGAFLYLYGIVLLFLSRLGFIRLTGNILFYFLNPREIARFYIAGRMLCSVYAMGTVLLTYLLAKKIWQSKTAGFLSAALLLFSPVFILNSHYMYVDIPGTFWIMLTLYLAVKFLRDERSIPFVMGLTSGMAAGNKITFVLSFFIPLAAFAISAKRTGEKFREGLYALSGFLAALILTNPFIFVSFRQLFRGPGQHATGLSFTPLFYICSLRYGLGLPLLLFLSVGSVIAFLKKDGQFRDKVLLAVWIIFFFALMSVLSLKFARYMLPIVPALAIFGTGAWFTTGGNRILRFSRNSLIVLMLLFTSAYGLSYERFFVQENVRTLAGKWIRENIPAGSSMGVTEVPWQFQMPLFDCALYDVVVTGYDFAVAMEKNPDYFVLSSFQAPIPTYPLRLQKERNDFWERFSNSGMYKEKKVFRKVPSFFGMTFKKDVLPEDLIYLNPTIVIFEKES